MKYKLQLSIDSYSDNDRNLVIDKLKKYADEFTYLSTEVLLVTNRKDLLLYEFSEYTAIVNPYVEMCIYDKKGKAHHKSHYSEFMMISFSEILRIIQGVIQIESKGELCPANWGPEKRTIKADLWDSTEYILKELLS